MTSKREERYLARARVREAASTTNSSLSVPLFDPALPRLPTKPRKGVPAAPGHIDQCKAKTATPDPFQMFLGLTPAAAPSPAAEPDQELSLADVPGPVRKAFEKSMLHAMLLSPGDECDASRVRHEVSVTCTHDNQVVDVEHAQHKMNASTTPKKAVATPTSAPTFAPRVVTNLADWHAVPASEGAHFYASRSNAAV